MMILFRCLLGFCLRCLLANMRSRPIISLILLLYFVDNIESKGRSIVRITEPKDEAPTYPSKDTSRKYYTYYINYFSPSGFYYAKTQVNNPRTVNTCENYEPFYGNDSYLGTFPCPMEADPEEFTHCCGQSRFEYCCKLEDTLSFQLGLGLGIVGALGLIIVIVVCVCLSLKSSQKASKAKKDTKRQMLQAGIPKYGSQSTGRYTATQSEDGYMITVRFKKHSFYDDFLYHLRNKYAALAWRNTEHKREVKVTFDDGSWVTLVLQDAVHGKPQLTVIREKAAVEWMDTVFEDICIQIPDKSGLCSCLTTKQKQVHPESNNSRATNGQRRNRYEMHHSRNNLGDKKERKY